MADNIFLSQAYQDWLEQLKDKIRSAQLKAALSVNTALILTYWELGLSILLQQQNQGWGAKVIDQLSKDLQKDFPLMQGFSPRNLKYMRKFAQTYSDFSIVQQVVAQIPWGHNLILLEKLQDNEQRLWYAMQAAENGLELQQFTGGFFRQQIFFLLNKIDTAKDFYTLMQNVFFSYYTSFQYIQI